jgi:hypothetical protein
MQRALLPSLIAATLTASVARADDGAYVTTTFSLAFPSIAGDGDDLTGSRVRAALGWRRGALAIEPALVLSSVVRHHHAMRQTTSVYDYASAGVQLKYLIGDYGAAAYYLRGGGHRSWTQATLGRPSERGPGLDIGFGIQLGHTSGRLAGGFFLDAGYETSWLDERIGMTYISLGLGGGTGF